MMLNKLLYRIARHASLAVMWIKWRTGYGLPFNTTGEPENYTFCRSEKCCLPQLPWSCGEIELSQLIAPHDYHDDPIARAAMPVIFEHDVNWHKAPDTGHDWPRKFFARIPCSPGNPVGDIQLVWRQSRLQHLIAFSLIGNLTDDLRIKHQVTQSVEKLMLSWISENPWLTGVNYISTMECGLRLMSVCHAFDMIRNQKISLQAWQGLLYLVHSHAYFIRRRLCLYSYAGNHTLGECAGLVYAGILFPELPDAEEWLRTGLKYMEQEASVQILQDGGNREQSFRYLAMITDLCGLVTALLKHHGKSVPGGIEQAWIRGSGFLQAFASAPDNLPAVGDSDDGYALSPYLRLSWQKNPRALRLPAQHLQIFETSGYSMIWGDAAHGHMRFSHGKLGTACKSGHGHADALSVCWDLGGKALLTDPGTYLYDGAPHFRRYFRGTSAHNTIIVNDTDQALQNNGTAFGWIRAYSAKLIWHEANIHDRTVLLANHDGYSGTGIMHWRALIYDRQLGMWIIWDRLDGTGEHTLALHWHIDAPVEMMDDGIAIECTDKPWFVHTEGGKSGLYRGNEHLPLGWISRKYGAREPLNTLKVETRAFLPHEFLTIISPQPGNQTQFFMDGELINTLRNKCGDPSY